MGSHQRVSCWISLRAEVKDIGNKLGAELRRLGEVVSENEWGMPPS